MKLAEALVVRADVQKRTNQMQSRLRQSALVQEGEQPPEDPQALLTQLAELLAQLVRLIQQINRTNIGTAMTDGVSLTDALARRDVLDQEISIVDTLADTAANRIERYGRSEIRKMATVDVAALRRRISELAQARRELDTAIQSTNWTTDLVE
ncbi:MAG: DIP1984 family protein [Ktedonobacterales bacterium]|nr:DIP1984 family protein [Ktedonobacterales bacterium]